MTDIKPTVLCGICACVYKHFWTKKLHNFLQAIWANEKHVRNRLQKP